MRRERLCCLYWPDRRLRRSSVNKIELSVCEAAGGPICHSVWTPSCPIHSLTHTHTHLLGSTPLYAAEAFVSEPGKPLWREAFLHLIWVFLFFFFFNIRGTLIYVDLHQTACRVLFDPCQLSLKPYVFSWHLYHNVGLIQTQLSVCVRLCDFVSCHRGIFAWLLVAALPVCLYSSADLVTPKATMITERELRVRRHIWTHFVWYECWEFELCFFFSQNLASTNMCLLITSWW